MTNELSHILTVAEIGQGRDVSLSADAEQCAAIAKRLDLIEVKSLTVDAKLSSVAGGVKAKGVVKAQVVQACAATDLPIKARIEEEFELRFLRNIDQADVAEDEEIEISSEDCEILPLEQERLDIGEVGVQSLSLALDPFPRHPDADRILAEKGILTEEQAGPFAALAALKGQQGK